MKRLIRNVIIVSLIYAAIILAVNIAIGNENIYRQKYNYHISINRTINQIEEYEKCYKKAVSDERELAAYTGGLQPGIISIHTASPGKDAVAAIKELEELEGDEYKVVSTAMSCYRIDYEARREISAGFVIFINLILAAAFAIVIIIIVLVYFRVLKPFHDISELPYELSKGNLTVPLEEQRSRLFGRFIWGLNLLREKLEDNKKSELELQREKKVLLVSLSHDIKTPLSAIKLYSTALSRDLYKDEAKRKEIARNIGRNADEIEKYISDIVKASNEDFLKFEVEPGEYYVKDIAEELDKYYRDKMKLNMIDFKISEYPNCMISCDRDRLIEVLQNLIENSIKYGDGKRICLYITKEEEEIHFLVKNTGCELAKKELPHVFDSFFRGSNVGSQPGSGLGLYICRELIRLMQGEIVASITEEKEMCVEVVVRLA